MPPKKSTAPPPASDESGSDFEDVPIKKPVKKSKNPAKSGNKTMKSAEQQLQEAADRLFDGSDGEDDDRDLFAMELPPRPGFLTKPNRDNRLMILNVEVENFKSYFGKACIGPFHKSFSSIIGPNGSGKSNLIDSLLFVFGFRAAKIRSAKVGNLIHKSRGREPNSCTVTIYFQRIIDMPGHHYQIVEGSKFTISRTAFRNNSSSYAIDGRPASKTEVEARLKLVDIDIEHNRFLILQGEVEQIAMMKPVRTNKNETGMIEYLEDIIGTNRLEPFVKLFQRRVNRLTCDQTQQRVIRDHVRNSKEAMQGAVKEAIVFLSTENEAKTIQMKLDQRKRLLYLDKVAPKQAELETHREEMNKIAEKLDSNKQAHREAEEADKKMNKERQKLDKQIDVLTKEVSDLTTEETRRKETIKRYETDIEKSQTEKEKEEKKRANLVSVPEKAEKKIAKWKEEVQQLAEIEETANAEADKNLDEFGKRTESSKEEQKGVQEAWAKRNAEFNKAKSAATVARDELEDMKKLANSGTKKLEELKNRLVKAEEKYDAEKSEMEKLKPEFEELNGRMKKLTAELPKAMTDAREKGREFAKARDRLDEIRQKNNSCSSNNRVVQMLMKEKAAGRINSFYGRIGDLGVIDPKYEAAICTNFGARLNCLVADNTEDCAAIINFFHANKLARHSIQSLKHLPNFSEKQLAPAAQGRFPGPRLYDLIDCEPEMKKLFYDVLRDTLVADNTADAQKFHKHPACRGSNIVTIQGTLIAASGAITGGGRPTTGLIATDRRKQTKTVTAEDLASEKQLEERLKTLKIEAEETSSRQKKMDAELFDVRRRLSEVENRLSHVTSSVEADGPAIETLKKTIVVQEKEASKVKVDKKEIEEKEKIVDELEKQRDELGEQAEEMKARQAEIQSKLDGIFKELVGCHRDEAKEAESKRQKLEKEMAKESASIANSGRNIAKCDDNIARLEKEIEKKRQLCEGLLEKGNDEEAVEEKRKTLEAIEMKRKDMEREYQELVRKQSVLNSAESALEEELKKCSEEVAELKESMLADQIRIKELDKKLSGIKVNRIPRFQFLVASTRPEDLEMQIDEKMPVVDENQSPEEVEKQKKHMACVLSDAAYALEFEMRKKVLENTESYENVDGEKLIPMELLSEEKIREITSLDAQQLEFKLKECEQKLETWKNKVDVSCLDAYVQKVKQFNEETIKLALVAANQRKHNMELQRIKQMRLEEFHNAFEFIGKHLVAVYKMLTDGGDAKLEYIDKDDPFLQGISFMVRPAKKAWKQIQFLSGGEKTLSSLALIFALHMFRPTPFYVMDEIDAALDYRNVSIIAQYVRQKTENAQFIIISLRNNMFELANRLIGIYKVDGCTQNVAIDPLMVCQMAKQISDHLGQATCTLPDEVSQRFNETMSRQNKEMTAQEKQYPNFPSTSEISKAEKIVNVEGRVRKELNQTSADPSRPQSKATTLTTTNHHAAAIERAASHRPESRANQMKIPAPRLVERSSTANSRSPRKNRNIDADETTPPTKRPHSTPSPTKRRTSPRKAAISGSAENLDLSQE